jgi:hypothetical protein
MKDPQFDKYIQQELAKFEVEPTPGLFDSIMNKRAQKKVPTTFPLFSSILFAGLAIVLSVSWVIIEYPKQPQTLASSNLSSEQIVANNTLVLPEIIENKSINESEIQEKQTINIIDFVETKSTKTHNEIASSEQQINKSDPYQRINRTPLQDEKASQKQDFLNNQEVVNLDYTSSLFTYVALSKKNLRSSFITKYLKLNSHLDGFMDYQKNFTAHKPKVKSPLKPLFSEIELLVGFGAWNTQGIKTSEDFLLSNAYFLQTQVRTRVDLKKNVRLLLGLQLNQRSVDYNYEHIVNHEKMHIDTVQGFIVDPGGTPIPVTRFDTSFQRFTEDKSASGRNKFMSFSLPIGLEYGLNLNRHQVFVNAGLLLQISAWSQGAWLNEEGGDIQSFSGRSLQYNTAFQMGSFAGIGYHYQLTPSFGLVLEAQYNRLGLHQSPTGTVAPHIVQTLGVSSGVKWKF